MACVIQRFFLMVNFHHLATKNKGLTNVTKAILGNRFKNSPYLEKTKKLEVAKFRQCVIVGCQN